MTIDRRLASATVLVLAGALAACATGVAESEIATLAPGSGDGSGNDGHADAGSPTANGSQVKAPSSGTGTKDAGGNAPATTGTVDPPGPPVTETPDAGGDPADAGPHVQPHPTPDAGPPAPACVPAFVVSEIQVAGSGGAADEFVEIANTANCSGALASFALKYMSATGTSATTVWTGASSDHIAANGRVVVGGRDFSGAVIGTLSGSTSGVLAAAGGGVGLYDATGKLVDSVGYGTASNAFVEASAAYAPASGRAIARSASEHDTDNNAADFTERTPTPGSANP